MFKNIFAGLLALLISFGMVTGSATAATYDALTGAVSVTEVSTAIVALAAILVGPQVVLWCVNKLRGMLGHK